MRYVKNHLPILNIQNFVCPVLRMEIGRLNVLDAENSFIPMIYIMIKSNRGIFVMNANR